MAGVSFCFARDWKAHTRIIGHKWRVPACGFAAFSDQDFQPLVPVISGRPYFYNDFCALSHGTVLKFCFGVRSRIASMSDARAPFRVTMPVQIVVIHFWK